MKNNIEGQTSKNHNSALRTGQNRYGRDTIKHYVEYDYEYCTIHVKWVFFQNHVINILILYK